MCTLKCRDFFLLTWRQKFYFHLVADWCMSSCQNMRKILRQQNDFPTKKCLPCKLFKQIKNRFRSDWQLLTCKFKRVLNEGEKISLSLCLENSGCLFKYSFWDKIFFYVSKQIYKTPTFLLTYACISSQDTKSLWILNNETNKTLPTYKRNCPKWAFFYKRL